VVNRARRDMRGSTSRDEEMLWQPKAVLPQSFREFVSEQPTHAVPEEGKGAIQKRSDLHDQAVEYDRQVIDEWLGKPASSARKLNSDNLGSRPNIRRPAVIEGGAPARVVEAEKSQ